MAIPFDRNNNSPLTSDKNCIRQCVKLLVVIWKIMWLIIPILFHVVDYITDIYLAWEYFLDQEFYYGSLTIAFFAIPAIACTWMHLRMQDDPWQDQEEDQMRKYVEKIARIRPHFVVVFLLHLTRPLRYYRILRYTCMVLFPKQAGNEDNLRYFHSKIQKEKVDLALINVVEGFTESCAQLILQLAILLSEEGTIKSSMWFKISCGCVTLIALAWSMMNYHCDIRLNRSDPPTFRISTKALLFFGHFGTVTGRIFVIAIAVSMWPLCTILACALIWLVWTGWLSTEDGVFQFCRDKTGHSSMQRTNMERIRTTLFAAVLSAVYMFTFVSVKAGRTRYRYIIYYTSCSWQNLIVLILWSIFANHTDENIWFPRALLILGQIIYFFGLAMLAIYYYRFHPTRQSKSCSSVTDHVLDDIECGIDCK